MVPKSWRMRRFNFRHLSPPNCPGYVLKEFNRALRGGQWAYGERAATLERIVEEALGVPAGSAVATSSATVALAVAGRMVINPEPVRVCPLTWPSTYCWVEFQEDFTWVDCDEAGWPVGQVDIGVELWGRPWLGDSPPILDAAHRVLAPEHGALLTSGQARAVVYSFALQKEVSCFMGGMLVVDPELAEEARMWLNSGTVDRIYKFYRGHNGLMPDPVATWIRHQLKRLPRLRAHRQRLLEEYHRHLGSILLTRPGECSGHLCVVDCGSEPIRRLYQAALDKSPSIPHSVHYPLADSFREVTPTAWALSKRVLTLPLHADMVLYDVRRVCARLLQA